MTTLSRIAAAMAALGISIPDARIFGRPSKHAFNKTGRNAGKRSRCRLKIARGAGSISAKADIHQLIRQGRTFQAAVMSLDHERQTGERILPKTVTDEWMLKEFR